LKKEAIKIFAAAVLFLISFIIWTILVGVIDVRPIGPQGSSVGFAALNGSFHEFTGVHMNLYIITDWLSIIPVCFIIGFGSLGLMQWIKRKNILKVDFDILILGVFYIIVMALYLLFEGWVINFRPVLINGILESSYPSSTTMLAMCVLPTAMMQFHRLIKNTSIRDAVNTLCGLFTAFMVIGRLVCGVHWFTDIVGGLIFSIAVILLYCSANNFILEKERKNHNKDV
jgi:undecaprenyl-diphosphatase